MLANASDTVPGPATCNTVSPAPPVNLLAALPTVNTSPELVVERVALPAAAVGRVFFDYILENRLGGIGPVPASEVAAPDEAPSETRSKSEA